MQIPGGLLIVCVLTGSSCAVFYTKSPDNKYPRIGRRSFYVSGDGNHYPRMGRRAAGSQLLLPESEFGDFAAMNKRGVFTQGAFGFPRMGRSGKMEEEEEESNFLPGRRNKLMEKIAGRAQGEKHSKEEQGDSNGADESREEEANIAFPFEILFITFDLDGDGKLSKYEFTSGMSAYSQRNPMC